MTKGTARIAADTAKPTPPRPVSLRDEAPPPPAPASPRHSGNQAVLLAITAVAFLLAGILIAVLVLGESDGLDADTVRDIVGTEVAARPANPVNAEGDVDPAAIQALVDAAVGTEVAALIPTNTPIPPTPTVIPNPVVADDDAFLGPEDAPIVIVEFSDFQCSFCSRFYEETLPLIRENYPDQVKFVYRDFPIFGEDSARAAMAAECAHEQGAFWEMHNRVFAIYQEDAPPPLSQDTLVSFADELGLDTAEFTTCLESQRYLDEVVNDYQTAVAYGFQGTPGFVINGVVYPFGAQPYDTFANIIESELALLETGG